MPIHPQIQPGVPIGIDALAIGLPRGYLELADLAAARGVEPAKYHNGIGTFRMAVASPEEDPVTLAVNAARRLFLTSGRDPAEVGLCIVGTETAVDHSKPVAAFVHGQLGLPPNCRTFETKHACFGGTAGVQNALDWIASGSARGRTALVVCSDIARYPLGSPGEPTQGGGAVALLLSARPRLIELEVGRSGCFTHDVYDFYRPLDRKDALTDGHFSVQCYLEALAGAYGQWRQLNEDGEPLARTVYHVPYGKMARKAHRHRCLLDGMSEQEADHSFAREVESSLKLPAQVGNIYTGSMYLALASLLHFEASQVAGRRIGLFSYGSGSSAEFFAGRVCDSAAEHCARLQLDAPLRERVRLSFSEYEELRRLDGAPERSDCRPAPAGQVASGTPERLHAQDAGLSGHIRYCGIDSGARRVYVST